MNTLRNLFIAGALAILSLTVPALAQQGAFPNYPIVGGAAYCSSTTNGVCTNTVPAGPTALTGNEQFPANTELSQGRSPQNVLITPAAIGALPAVLVDASTTTTLSADNFTGGVIFHKGSGISTAGVTLPPSPIDNQTFFISSNATITTLTVTPGGSTTIGANTRPTALTASLTLAQGYKFLYNLAGNVWYRVQ